MLLRAESRSFCQS